MSEFRCRSTFCVINNPEYTITYKHDEAGEIIKGSDGKPEILTKEPTEYNGLSPQQICDVVLNKWISDDEEHTGYVAYCISAVGLEHLHCVFESKSVYRPLTVLKRLFPKIHIEPTKGSKKDVEDYVNKVGKFEEKGEKVIASSQVGEIIGCQGKRTDLITLDEIKQLIFEDNQSPRDIFLAHPKALKEEKAVNYLYFQKRLQDTPLLREIEVNWLCGHTGCGKSYEYVKLCKKYGADNVYLVSDYNNPFDNYQGQDVVIFDEFRGQFRLAEFLQYTQGYRQEIRARYSNKYALWTKVYITSPVTPYEVYRKDGDTTNANDKLQQIYRRINNIIYCFKVEKADYTYYFQNTFECSENGCANDMYNEFSDCRRYYTRQISFNSSFVGDDTCNVSKVKTVAPATDDNNF